MVLLHIIQPQTCYAFWELNLNICSINVVLHLPGLVSGSMIVVHFVEPTGRQQVVGVVLVAGEMEAASMAQVRNQQLPTPHNPLV